MDSGLRPLLVFHLPAYHHSHHRYNVVAPHGRPRLRSRLHYRHNQEGKPRKFVRTCGGIGGGGFEDTVGYSTVSVLINHVYAHRHIWQTLLSFSSLLGKVKVECTLIPTLRLCTGRTAHRGSRGIALLFLDHDTRRGMRGQRHAPAALYPWERPGTHCTGGWVGPRASLDRRGKSRPHRDSIPGPSNP